MSALPPGTRSLIQQLQQASASTQRGARRIRRGLAWRLGKSREAWWIPSDHPASINARGAPLAHSAGAAGSAASTAGSPRHSPGPGRTESPPDSGGRAPPGGTRPRSYRKKGCAPRGDRSVIRAWSCVHEPLLAELPGGRAQRRESRSAKELTWSEASLNGEDWARRGRDALGEGSSPEQGTALGSHPAQIGRRSRLTAGSSADSWDGRPHPPR